MIALAIKLGRGLLKYGERLTAGFTKVLLSPAAGPLLGCVAIFLGLQLIGVRGDLRGTRAQVARFEAAERQAIAQAAEVSSRQAATTSRIEEKAAIALQRERTITRSITKEIPLYVPVEADGRCIIPVGFVRLHDGAATGRLSALSEPAGRADEAPSGAALSEVGRAGVENYGVARENAEQLKALQEWVREMAAAAR